MNQNNRDVFINPYTFVPLQEGTKAKLENDPGVKKNTGKISCKLITKGNVIIPDTNQDGESKNLRTYKFFRVDHQAVIPGSSIRGPIRSIYEMLTNSCMHTNDDYFSSRDRIKSNCGLLHKENGKFVLTPCTRFKAHRSILEGKKTGDIVKFLSNEMTNTRFNQNSYNNRGANSKGQAPVKKATCLNNTGKEGYVLIADTFNKGKKNESNPSILSIDMGGRKKIIPDAYIKALKENIKKYEPKNAQVKTDYENCFYEMIKGEGRMLPVWYREEGGKYYFAPSQISRSVYTKKQSDFLKEINLHACDNAEDEICPACALFGLISKKQSMGSRVRFSDAICISPDPFDRVKTLPILSTPRVSSFEFYLSNNKEEKQYDADSPNIMLSGRKWYWHHNTGGKASSGETNNEMQAAYESVKGNTTFLFDVYFNGITDQQLNELLFSLTLGDNREESKQCHKIGHGKPVGYGSVKIVAEKVQLRDFTAGQYNVHEDTDFSNRMTNIATVCDTKALLKASNFNAVEGNLIDYPRPKGEKDIFSWFSNNRKTFNDKKMEYLKTLPKLTDPVQYLEKNEKQSSNHNNSKQSKNNNTRR